MASPPESDQQPHFRIELGDLKESGDELAAFLSGKCRVEVQKEGASLRILPTGRGAGLARILRTYLKKFLHQKGLRGEVRVLLRKKVFTLQSLEEGEEPRSEE